MKLFKFTVSLPALSLATVSFELEHRHRITYLNLGSSKTNKQAGRRMRLSNPGNHMAYDFNICLS